MTRLTDFLLSRMGDPMKKFNNYHYRFPYKQVLPAALSDKVSGRKENRKTLSCLQEMSLMLVCLKKHEFEQARCPKEIEAFVACNKQHMQAQSAKGEKSSTDLANSMLKKYPQPRSKS